jgi:hypothetical protein
MKSWFNPRVFVVAISIVLMVQVSKLGGDPDTTIHRALITCAVMLFLYILAFLLPLLRCFGLRRIVIPGLSLIVAWTSVALAIVADALPITLEEQMAHRMNWPMDFACLAAAAAFYLFFENTARALRQREELLAARGGRSRDDDW